MAASIRSWARDRRDRISRKWLWLSADVAVHLGLLAWILIAAVPEPPVVRRVGSELTVLDLPTTQASAPSGGRPAPSRAQRPPDPVPAALAEVGDTPPPPSLEQQVAALIGARASEALAVPTEQSFAGVAASRCDLTAPVEAALRTDPLAMAAVSQLPPSTLSIANAYMLWDTAWIAPRTSSAEQTLDPIRAVITTQIALASPECLAEPQAGPRLIVLGDTQSPVTLVIGSGEWRWGDLTVLTPPVPPIREARRWPF